MDNDLISRSALKDQFANECLHNCYYCKLAKWDKKGACYNCGLIDNAPTVKFSLMPADETKEDAYKRGYKKGKIEGILIGNARQQGEWIYNDKLNMYYCKDCGLLEPFTKEEIEEGAKLPNFCEQCGAAMNKNKEAKDNG